MTGDVAGAIVDEPELLAWARDVRARGERIAFANAAAAPQKAIAKGGLTDADNAEMLLGIALKRKGDKAASQKAFDEVKDPKFAEIAKLWKIAAR